MLRILLAYLFALSSTLAYIQDCSKAEYDRCVRIADPLVREAHLVFPDNMDDIDLVCRMWNKFVDCIKRYTDKCFTDQQRRQFNRAVENPIQSVHEMCLQPHYQKEYLRYASCIKSTITERVHCGPQYSLLVDQVEQGDTISKATLCCSHEKFKECVRRETRKLCDRGQTDGPAAQFSNQILEKALSFIQEQCFNYIPNSEDCNKFTTDTLPYYDPLAISASSSEVYPWSTIDIDAIGKEMPSSKVTPSREVSVSWIPSSQQPDAPVLGTRTRPASYGRSNWPNPVTTTQNREEGSNTIQVSSVSSTPPSKPDWATVSIWTGLHQSPGQEESSSTANTQSTPTTWYPAAGFQTANEVDEPNQQGLLKPKNGAPAKQLFSLTVIATVLTAFC